MSEISTNRSLSLHKDNLNPFALWDDVFLNKEAFTKEHLATFYDTIARIAWVGFMVFSACFVVAFGLLNGSALPTALYVLIQLYQPYMEFTYHAWKARSESEKKRKLLYKGLSSTYETLQKLPETALKARVTELQSIDSPEKGELFLPLLAQYNYFKKTVEDKVVALQQLKEEILNGDMAKEPEEEQDAKRELYFTLEESICVQKIELAYLMHLLNHPFDKKKLSTFGVFEQKELNHYCSWQAFYRSRSAPFFTPKQKESLSRDNIQSLEILELYRRIYLDT